MPIDPEPVTMIATSLDRRHNAMTPTGITVTVMD
jgi:hypothetical protein